MSNICISLHSFFRLKLASFYDVFISFIVPLLDHNVHLVVRNADLVPYWSSSFPNFVDLSTIHGQKMFAYCCLFENDFMNNEKITFPCMNQVSLT